MSSIEVDFENAMMDVYRQSVKIGYKPIRFLEMLSNHGAKETARMLIHSKEVPEGYIKLWELGRLDISVENLVRQEKYKVLFTKEEVDICINRLKQYKFI